MTLPQNLADMLFLFILITGNLAKLGKMLLAMWRK